MPWPRALTARQGPYQLDKLGPARDWVTSEVRGIGSREKAVKQSEVVIAALRLWCEETHFPFLVLCHAWIPDCTSSHLEVSVSFASSKSPA